MPTSVPLDSERVKSPASTKSGGFSTKRMMRAFGELSKEDAKPQDDAPLVTMAQFISKVTRTGPRSLLGTPAPIQVEVDSASWSGAVDVWIKRTRTATYLDGQACRA